MAKAELKIVTKGGDKAKAELKGIGDGAGDVRQRVMDTASAMQSFASGLSQVAQAAKQMVDESINAFAGFDQAMANTISIAQGTNEQFEKMRDSARQMAKEMPISAEEIASGYYELASAGLDANQIMTRTPAIMKLATASAADFSTVAKGVNSVLSIYGDKAGGAEHVTDVFMNTVKGFMTTMPELGETFRYAASSAELLGVPLEELSASIGILRNSGMQATQAGTALRAMFTKLVKPGDEAKEMMEKYGIEVKKNRDGSLDMAGTLKTFKSFMDDTTDSTVKMAVAQTLFGTRGAEAALKLAKNVNQLEEYSEEMGKAGSVQKAFDLQMEGAGNQLKVLENKLADVRIEMGENMLPTQIKLTEAKIGFYNALTNLPGPLADVAGGAFVVVGEFGGMFASIIRLIPGLMILKGALVKTTIAQWNLNAAIAANPIGLLVAAIIITVAAIVLLTYHWDTLEKKLGKLIYVWMIMLGTIGLIVLAIQGVMGIVKNWGDITDWLKDKWNTVINFFASFGSKVADIFWDIIDFIKSIPGMAYDWGKDLILEFINGIKSAVNSAIDTVKNVVKKITSPLTYDILSNDLMAQKWGADLIHHHILGQERAINSEAGNLAGIGRGITSSVTNIGGSTFNFGSGTRGAGRYNEGAIVTGMIDMASEKATARGLYGGVMA